MLEEGEVGSLSDIAKKERLTRARVTQIMNLLKLPEEIQELLAGLEDRREIRKYSERRLRGDLSFVEDLEGCSVSAMSGDCREKMEIST